MLINRVGHLPAWKRTGCITRVGGGNCGTHRVYKQLRSLQAI